MIGNLVDKTRYYLKTIGSKTQKVSIPEIPEEWSFFAGTKCKWKKINIEGTSSCEFIGEDEYEMGDHYHMVDEYILVLSGKVTVQTPKGTFIYKKGDFFKIPKGEENRHIVLFEDDIDNETGVVEPPHLIIHWLPPFAEGWEASVPNEK